MKLTDNINDIFSGNSAKETAPTRFAQSRDIAMRRNMRFNTIGVDSGRPDTTP